MSLRAAAQAVVEAWSEGASLDAIHELLVTLSTELSNPPEPVAFVLINPIRVEFNPLYPIWKLPLNKNPLYAGDKP